MYFYLSLVFKYSLGASRRRHDIHVAPELSCTKWESLGVFRSRVWVRSLLGVCWIRARRDAARRPASRRCSSTKPPCKFNEGFLFFFPLPNPLGAGWSLDANAGWHLHPCLNRPCYLSGLMQRQIRGNFDRKHPPDLLRCASVHSVIRLRLETRGGRGSDNSSYRHKQDVCFFCLLFKQFAIFPKWSRSSCNIHEHRFHTGCIISSREGNKLWRYWLNPKSGLSIGALMRCRK